MVREGNGGNEGERGRGGEVKGRGRKGKEREGNEGEGKEGEGKEGRERERKKEFIPQCSLAVDATVYTVIFCDKNVKPSGRRLSLECSTPRSLWQSINALMGRGYTPLSTSIDAQVLHRFFHETVAGVRESVLNFK